MPTELFLRAEFDAAWRGRDPFDAAEALEGRAVREIASRSTIRFQLGDRWYYAKRPWRHRWLEMLKNWITLKAPVLDASNEYQAAGHLKTHGLNTLEVAAYGRTGWNPAQRRSFLITDEIAPVVSLEQFCLPWLQTPPPVRLKRDLLQRVAEIARTMHAAGVNHRDFYICHLLLTQPDRTPQDIPPIFVVDLHRAQLRRRVPRRWLIRDLAALCFSSPRHRLDPTRCVSFFETLLRPGAGARSWARKQRCSTSSTTARTGCMPKPNEKAFLPGRSPPQYSLE